MSEDLEKKEEKIEVEAPTALPASVSEEIINDCPDNLEPACKKDTDAILDAVRELTKVTAEISAQWEKWRIAGKF